MTTQTKKRNPGPALVLALLVLAFAGAYAHGYATGNFAYKETVVTAGLLLVLAYYLATALAGHAKRRGQRIGIVATWPCGVQSLGAAYRYRGLTFPDGSDGLDACPTHRHKCPRPPPS